MGAIFVHSSGLLGVLALGNLLRKIGPEGGGIYQHHFRQRENKNNIKDGGSTTKVD